MKKYFKALLLILSLVTLTNICDGQNNYEDVVYLKNGSIIHGIVIEQVPNQSIKIKTKDNNVFVFKMDEITTVRLLNDGITINN